MTYQLTSTAEISRVISKSCDPDTVASVIDSLLTAEENEQLSDREAMIGAALFEELTTLRPDCAELATGGK